jgi:hypothetical protein
MPDDLLLAAAGRLGDPEALRAQTERMLSDPRADRFVEDFLDQWLTLRDLDATTPDTKLYPEFEIYLRDSMAAETRAYFREMVKHDLSVLQIVDWDWAMLNQRLAEHYALPVGGGRVRVEDGASSRKPSGRAPDPGQRPESHRQRDDHVARHPRRVGARPHPGPSAPASASGPSGHRARRARLDDDP